MKDKKIADNVNEKESVKIYFDYAFQDVDCKARDKHDGSFPIINVHANKTMMIHCGYTTECINI